MLFFLPLCQLSVRARARGLKNSERTFGIFPLRLPIPELGNWKKYCTVGRAEKIGRDAPTHREKHGQKSDF
jgi:hypothetical protein